MENRANQVGRKLASTQIAVTPLVAEGVAAGRLQDGRG